MHRLGCYVLSIQLIEVACREPGRSSLGWNVLRGMLESSQG